MKRHTPSLRPALSLALLLIHFLPLEAQKEVVRFERIGMEKGLPQGQIMDIIQDREGFLWFSTMNSLVKYDGYNFVEYRHDPEDSTSLSHVTPGRIYEDKAGYLWVGSHSGLSRWDRKTNRFTRFLDRPGSSEKLLNSTIEAMLEDSRGWFWAATHDGLIRRKNGRFHKVADLHCISLLEGSDGCIWVGTNNGLLKVNPENDAILLFPVVPEGGININVLALYPGPDETFWAGTSTGLFRWDPALEEYHKIPLPGSWQQQAVREIIQDEKGRLWLATVNENGIFRLRPQTGELQHFTHGPANSFSISSNHVRAFCIDRRNQLWIGAYNGLNKVALDPPRFTLLQHKTGLGHPENQILRAHQDNRGGFWSSTYGKKLFHAAEPGLDARELSFPGLNPHSYWFFCSLSEEEVCFNTNTTTIAGYNLRTGQARMIGSQFSKEDSRLLRPREYMEEDVRSPGILWLSSAIGLCKLTVSTGEKEFFPPGQDIGGLQNDHVLTALQVGGDQIYVQLENDFNGRLARFQKREEQYVPIDIRTAFPNKKNRLHTRQFAATPDGTAWIASAEGLGIIHPGTDTLSLMRIPDGLIDDNLMGISADRQGNVWLKSLHHISRYDPALDSFWHFKVGEDMQEFNTLYVVRGIDGRLFFPGNNGIYACYPEAVRLDTSLPRVVLTDFAVLDTSRHFGTSPELIREIALGHRDNVFSFEFAGLHTPNPKAIRYRYRLEGFDGKWTEAGPERKATYTNLGAGRYTFKVVAANADGIWNEANPLVVRLLILPPPWLTWWAYCLYALLIAGTLYSIYRFQLNRRLEKAEARRIRELEQFKSRFFTNITHEFRTPLTIILGMADKIHAEPGRWLSQGTDMIKRNGRNLLRLVNQMLDLSRLESGRLPLQMEQGNVVPFFRYIIESFHSYAETRDIQIRFLAEQEEVIMDYDQDKLMNIVSNLLSNAIKFTPEGGEVYVTADGRRRDGGRTADLLLIKIRDTGIGIPEGQLPYIFDRFYRADDPKSYRGTRKGEGAGIGLALCKELVKLMGGSINVKSKVGEGTTFEVLLPIRNEAELAADRMDAMEGLLVASAAGGPDGPHGQSEAKAGMISNGKPLALIIEDNKDVVQFLISCLGEQYQAIVAYDGQEGIDKAIEQVPDVIISDVMMPEKDGFEVCATLKNDERTSHIPIVLLTAKADVESRIAGLKRGADAYLAKPFHEEELLVRLDKLIELRRELQKRYASFPLPATADEHLRAEDEFLHKVWAVIDGHLDDAEFDLPKLCRSIGMSRSQVFRKLKALTGRSTTEVIRSYRLYKGKALLQSTDMNISEVAYSVGFSSLNYFTRCFKKEFGAAPSEWRK